MRQVAYTLESLREPLDGVVYRFDGEIRTVQTKDLLLKSCEGFNSVRDCNPLELSIECAELWKELGFKGFPSNPASFFHELNRKEELVLPFSFNSGLANYIHGGWSQTLREGAEFRLLEYYDMRSAYLWGGLSGGLPSRILPYERGDKNFIAVIEVPKINRKLPTPLRAYRFIVTNNELDIYGITEFKIIFALKLANYFNVEPLIEKIEKLKLPEQAKKLIYQSFWGRWGSTEFLQRETWKNGKLEKITSSRNRSMNLIWSMIIINRVLSRVWENSQGANLVMIDALLTGLKLKDAGEKIGDFKVKKSCPEGAYVANSGLWTPFENGKIPKDKASWFKHMGIKPRSD